MSNFYIKWLMLLLKRNIKSLTFYFTAFLLVVVTYLICEVSNSIENNIKVLLFSEDSENGTQIIDELISENIDGYYFEEISNPDEINEKVLKGDVALAVIFHDGLDNAIKSGNYNGEVEIIQSASSSEGYILKEVIFPYIQKAGANNTLKSYIEKCESDIPDDIENRILEKNAEFLDTSDLSIFKVIETDNEGLAVRSFLNFEKVCIIFIIVFIVILVIADTFYSDRAFYFCQKKSVRAVLKAEKVFSYIIMLIIVCIATLCMIKLK